MIEDTFGRLALPKLLAGVKPENGPSVRVMAKLGFAWESDITTHGHSFGLFGLTPQMWAQRAA